MKRNSREIFTEAIINLLATSYGGVGDVPLSAALQWASLKYPDTKVDTRRFYEVRQKMKSQQTVKKLAKKTTPKAAAQTTGVPPLQLIRTIKGWVDTYGKDELIAMINEICP
jgi:hypothetical protein